MVWRTAWVTGAVMAACLQGVPVLAQSLMPLPPEVEAARREAVAACPGRATLKAGFIQSADFNGDGRPDFLVDEGRIECSGSPPLFCGSGGCSWALYLSGPGGYRKVLDGLSHRVSIDRTAQPPILATQDRGGSARLQWNGRAMAPAGRR